MPDVKCDRCDKPATVICRDVLRHEAPGQAFAEYSTLEPLKAGCDEHPVKSEEYVTMLPRVVKRECSHSPDGLHRWQDVTKVGDVLRSYYCTYCEAQR